jgi:hypothetical protein
MGHEKAESNSYLKCLREMIMVDVVILLKPWEIKNVSAESRPVFLQLARARVINVYKN